MFLALAIPASLRGGWHYWQRPSGENAAGAKRGGPAPGEHREEREPGRWKSQGKPGHLTEMEGPSGLRKRRVGCRGGKAPVSTLLLVSFGINSSLAGSNLILWEQLSFLSFGLKW